MGIISIDVHGSFGPQKRREFSAQQSGHAVAAEDAISWMQSEILKPAKELDRKLRLGKDAPEDDWAEFDKRHPFQEIPSDVIAEKVFTDISFDEPLRFSHCTFHACTFHRDCVFTDCMFETSTVRGELVKCNLVECAVLATVFIHCQAKQSDVTVCHIKPSWEDDE